MTRRERVLQAIRHMETDITPYQIDFTEQEYEKIALHLGDPDFFEKTGNHMEITPCDEGLMEIDKASGVYRDVFGVQWHIDEKSGVADPSMDIVLKEPVLSGYLMPEPDEERIRRRMGQLTGNGKDTFKAASIGFSLFERAWSLRGMENLLTDLAAEPGFVEELLDAITDYNLKVMDIALEYAVDGFHFGDDWGQQKGLIMGAGYWRRYIRPRLARMYEKAKSKGKIVSQHSCGDILEVFPDLIELGLDIYQTFQPEIYDLEKVKKEYGSSLTFWGGISTQRLLPFADPAEIRRVTVKTLEIMGKGGGYIIAPTHDVPGDVPPENILAMLEVFQNQKKYVKR